MLNEHITFMLCTQKEYPFKTDMWIKWIIMIEFFDESWKNPEIVFGDNFDEALENYKTCLQYLIQNV